MTNSRPWLITGGAGYIGAHVAEVFLQNGKEVLIYDSLFSGLYSRVDYLSNKYGSKIAFVEGDIRDRPLLSSCITGINPHGIIHLAALKSVEDSISKPSEYMDVNFRATKELLNLALMNKTQNFIYSSTAAVYGSGIQNRGVKEDDTKNPESPYGESKLLAEMEVQKFLAIPENRGTSLRFFNVVGAADFHLQDNSVGNLIPILLRRIQKGLPPIVFGNDYPTRDGTCIRDYVDVRDVARCHFAVTEIKHRLPFAINVGTGKGFTVSEVIEIVRQEYGMTDLKIHFESRREGDPATLFADIGLIKSEIDFEAQYSLQQAIACILGFE